MALPECWRDLDEAVALREATSAAKAVLNEPGDIRVKQKELQELLTDFGVNRECFECVFAQLEEQMDDTELGSYAEVWTVEVNMAAEDADKEIARICRTNGFQAADIDVVGGHVTSRLAVTKQKRKISEAAPDIGDEASVAQSNELSSLEDAMEINVQNVHNAKRARQLETRKNMLLSPQKSSKRNSGMLRLTVKFFKCKPPYQFHEDITVGVREQATSEEVAETCAERVLEVSREHGEPFELENVSLFASKPCKLFVLGKASEYFRDGDDVHICGQCVRSNSHGHRDRQDERAAASEPTAAASAFESNPEVQRMEEGERRGRRISARNAVAHLRDAVQDHLSAIFLISKHGSAERRQEAQCILDRYKGKDFSYHTGWDKKPSSPLADWNRMGAYVMSSFVHIERSYAAAQANLRKAEFFEAA